MYRLLTAFLLIMLVWGQLPAQVANDCSYVPPKEGRSWCFYSNIWLNFTGGTPVVSSLPVTLDFGKGCASIADENGNLILFTNGMRLWDKNAFPLSTTLPGDLGSTQSALIVPNPDKQGRYYIFTTHLLYPAPMVTYGLNYSEINLTTASGTDTLRMKKLLDETPEKLTGVHHANGIDFWVVAHGWNNNSFYAYKVTQAGVDSIPVVSSAGMIQSGSFSTRNMVGAMKLSPDGSKLAMAIMGANKIEWFDFDNSTGRVLNARDIPSPDANSPYSIEFSPDNSKLYFTTVTPSTNASNNLYQLDLVNGGAPVLLNRLSKNMTALQLAVDGKIYVARYLDTFLGVIENPNRPDTACNYREDALNLNGQKGLLGLPNFIQSYFDIPALDYDTKCLGDDTYFYLLNKANIDSISWDFGDPSSGSNNSSNLLDPTHQFSAAGDYKVQWTEWFANRSFITSSQVTINKLPPKSFASLGDSVYILPGSSILLNGGDFMKTYLWQNGATTQSIEASEPGYYNVTIVDTNCCQQSDTLKILLLDLFVPTAFSPNFDGKNDRFRVKGPTQGIDNFRLSVYNRWGQLIWETNNFGDGWDGTYNGTNCPLGAYTWVLSFGVTGNIQEKNKVVKRGVVTLIR